MSYNHQNKRSDRGNSHWRDGKQKYIPTTSRDNFREYFEPSYQEENSYYGNRTQGQNYMETTYNSRQNYTKNIPNKRFKKKSNGTERSIPIKQKEDDPKCW